MQVVVSAARVHPARLVLLVLRGARVGEMGEPRGNRHACDDRPFVELFRKHQDVLAGRCWSRGYLLILTDRTPRLHDGSRARDWADYFMGALSIFKVG